MTDESDGELRVSIHPEDGDAMYLAAAATESAQEGELWAGAESAEEDELPVATASVEEGELPVTTESAEEGELWAGAESAEESELPEVSRKVTPRSRTRRTRPRSKTIALRRLTRVELQRGAEMYPPVEDVERPRTREDCRDAPRPCPWVACKHHLYLDINPRTGSIKINFPDLEPWELEHTCALDVADGGGLTLEEIGVITNLTRERVRQVEVRGLLTLRTRSNALR